LLYDFIVTVLMSALGALASVLVWAKSWRDLTEFEAVKSLALGILVGVFYYVLRVEHGFPDDAVSFAIGYSAKDMIEALVERFKPETRGGSP
jgi:4-amino-4-deoxy-L-arabinose transferase-like glycosyltransferase